MFELNFHTSGRGLPSGGRQGNTALESIATLTDIGSLSNRLLKTEI